MNAELTELLKKHNANFTFENGKWCLSGTTGGLGWETDDYEADTREQAEQDAIAYLIEYNS